MLAPLASSQTLDEDWVAGGFLTMVLLHPLNFPSLSWVAYYLVLASLVWGRGWERLGSYSDPASVFGKPYPWV